MKEKITWKGAWEVLKNSFKGASDNSIAKLSASLAYYTVFSMGPLLIVIISLCSFFLGREAVEGRIYESLAQFMGSDTAIKLEEIIKNASVNDKETTAAIVGVITLLIGATTVFAEIQDSINTIWGLKPKPKKGWLKMIQNRFLSFSVVVSLAFILLVSLAITTVIDALSNRLQAAYPEVAVIIFYVSNQLITLAVITLIFAVVYKVLPDARIRWKDVLAGAVIAALLFMLGKFGVSFYISQSDIGSTYGAAGSLVIILLWTYYSSLILYFGAELTKAYAIKYGGKIIPNDYAVTLKQVEVETGRKSVQNNESSDVKVTLANKKGSTKKDSGNEHRLNLSIDL